jgi:hypothetical protein
MSWYLNSSLHRWSYSLELVFELLLTWVLEWIHGLELLSILKTLEVTWLGLVSLPVLQRICEGKYLRRAGFPHYWFLKELSYLFCPTVCHNMWYNQPYQFKVSPNMLLIISLWCTYLHLGQGAGMGCLLWPPTPSSIRESSVVLRMGPYKNISHIQVLITSFLSKPTHKPKLSLQIGGRLLIATHLEQSNYLANQTQGAVNKSI